MSTKTWLSQRNLFSTHSTPVKNQKEDESLNELLHIGDEVIVNNSAGIIRFIGPTDFKAGTWVGIELNHIGTGKNDGSIYGKRYFLCPPKSGLFILASKLIKQQHLINRPLTPYQSNQKKSLVNLPPFDLSFSHSSTPTLTLPPNHQQKNHTINPPLPNLENQVSQIVLLENTIKQLTLENQRLKQLSLDDQFAKEELELEHQTLKQEHQTLKQEHQTLKQEHQTLKQEHQTLKQEHQTLKEHYQTLSDQYQDLSDQHQDLKDQYNLSKDLAEQKLTSLKKTSMDTIEILENMLQSEFERAQAIEKAHQILMAEKEGIENASLETIELYEESLNRWQVEREKHKEEKARFLKDIEALELVLQQKVEKEAEWVMLIRKEREFSTNVSEELKMVRFQYDNHLKNVRWSYRVMDRLDTPIEEEEDDDYLLDQPCPLCDQKGHSIIHCQLIQKVN